MPRLRYKKSYDFTLYEEDEREAVSGNSWLSNATIAAQLSDKKIKQTISALKAQITVLEAELLSRRLNGGHETNRNWNKIGNLRGPEDGERLYYRANRKDSKPRKHKQFQKVTALRKTLAKLGVKDVNALLNEWSKITEKEP
jgi:uncharacterized small protein (DUF1192 family)